MPSARVYVAASLCIVVAVMPAPAASQTTGGYHVVKRLEVGGEGGWDYLTTDPAAHRLYISRSTHVMVYDTDRDTVVGDIPNTLGVHGVAIASDLGRGFTSNGRDSSVTIFDPKTLAEIGRVRVTGRNPDAILYEPATKRVFTFNGGSANATAIDAAAGTVVGTVTLGGKPETAQVEGGRVFVNIEDRNEIAVFDPKTLQVQAHWSLAPCEEPTGMAIDRAHKRLVVGCGGNSMIAIVDYTTGRVVTTVPAGAGIDAAGFDPATQLAFASNGQDGTLTVAHEDTPDRFRVIATVPTQRGARTMALDVNTHKIYTVSARYGETPAPTADRPRPRPPIVAGSFTILVLEP